MSEIHEGPSPEELEKQKQKAQHELRMRDYLDIIIAPEDLRDCEPEIAEFEAMLESFESAYSLEELLLVTDLTLELFTLLWNDRDMSAEEIKFAIKNLKPEDVRTYEIRTKAKKNLIPIVSKMNAMKAETNISPERHDELKAKYRRLSRAVGMINNKKVCHK